MKILVTGGAGFIGSHVVDLLVARGHAVTVIDNLDTQVHGEGASEPLHLAGHLKTGAVRFVRGDVTDRAVVENALMGAEAVVHLAAAVGVGQSMYAPHYYVHTNASGTGMLLDLIARDPSAIRKLVVASSMSLYGEGAYGCPSCGGHQPSPRDEEQLAAGSWEVHCARCGDDMTPLPTPETKVPEIASVYAATKKHQEELFVTFGRAYRLPTFALRFFNVFGPRQSLGNPYTGVAAIFLSRLLNGQPPLLFEDGGQSRDFVYVKDVAEAVRLAVEHEGPGAHVLNVGTGRRTTVLQIAEALARHVDVELAPLRLNRYRAGDIRHCVADPSRARETLGFEARTSFEEGLPALVAWCRGQRPPDRVEASMDELFKKGLVR
jgi:dTDP-L-rhamnose 4-epimerase